MTMARNTPRSTAHHAAVRSVILPDMHNPPQGRKLCYKEGMKRRPKHYRQQIYDYIEEMLGRPLTFEEHDTLRDMIGDYVFSMANMRAIFARTLCIHDWKVDKKVEADGQKFKMYVKCVKCDKRTSKKMSYHSLRV